VGPAHAAPSPEKPRRTERRWLAVLALVLLTLPAGPIGATERLDVHTRRDRGGARTRADLVVPRDAPTIQAAIDLAEDGGSIFVLPGVYREMLRIVGKRLRVSGGGRAALLGEPPRAVDPAERAVGLVTYLEGGGGVFEGFELRGGPNGIVGQPPSGPPGGEGPVPEAHAHAVTIRDVQITNSGRGILWRAGSDLLVEGTRIRNMLHHGVVFKPIAPGPSVKLIDVAVAFLAGWGYLIFDTTSVGCQNQLVNPGALGAQQGGIGVFRSGVCIFGGVLLANQRAGIYFQQSAAIVDGTQILETAPPNGVGILAFASELQKIVNAELDGNDEIGIQLVGSTAVLGWDTLNCHGIHLAGNTLPAGHLGPSQPPAPVPPFVEPLFGNDGGVWCGCGETQVSCEMASNASVPAAVTPAE
jgi:hypothetical protein